MKELITVEEAAALIAERTPALRRMETIPLPDATGRILARDILAPMDQPPFDRSPVDGYACHSAALSGASEEHPVRLQVVAEVDAGGYWGHPVGRREAVRIMTGAPVPAGCDCCVRQEDTDYGEEYVQVFRSCRHHENICFRGEDYQKDTKLLTAGTRIGGIEAGLLAGMGFHTAEVYEAPKVILITTGDEVVQPGEPLTPGKIYDANQYLLAGRFRELGLTVYSRRTVRDDPVKLVRALSNASEEADLVLTTGGVSVGRKDLLQEALQSAGAEKIFWRVLSKPGTPVIFSVLKQTPVISLSGNPFGALANFELLARPALKKLTGDAVWDCRRRSARMADTYPKASYGRRFLRAILKGDEIYLPQGLHSSGVLSSMRSCNCMIDIPAGTMKLAKGDKVSVLLLGGGGM